MNNSIQNSEVLIGDCIKTLRKKHKIKKSEYLSSGVIPVVDQSQAFIAGYINDTKRAYDEQLPVIVFGDHTCTLKYVNFPFAVGADGTQLIRPTKDFDIRYFYYALRNLPLEHFGYQRHFKYLKTSKIFCPSMHVQRKIAAILSAYDDLIENNTRRIKILEDMAQTLYREWFVHFRFPGHENVPMVESALGQIPQGWEVVPASEAIFVNPKTSVPRDAIKPFVPMKSATEHSMLITEIEEKTGNSGAKFKNGDTLFARITPCLENGRTGFVQFLPNDDEIAFGSTEFIVLRSRTLNPYFVYLLAQTRDFRENAIKSMTGATGRQRVLNECFDDYFLPNPNREMLCQFEITIAPLFKKVQNLSEKNANLRQTRDLLLPKLISGEIDVSELDIDTDNATMYNLQQGN